MPPLASNRLIAVLIGTALCTGRYSTAAPTTASPDAALLKAISLEQKTDPERVTYTITQSGGSDSGLIEKANGRSHFLRQTSAIKTELYVVDKIAYWRVNGGSWIKQPITHPITVPLNPSILFKKQLTRVVAGPNQTVAGKSAKTYRGSISWASGGRSCSGELLLAVSTSTGLPANMTVKGDCESIPVTISESFEYGSSIHIDAP